MEHSLKISLNTTYFHYFFFYHICWLLNIGVDTELSLQNILPADYFLPIFLHSATNCRLSLLDHNFVTASTLLGWNIEEFHSMIIFLSRIIFPGACFFYCCQYSHICWSIRLGIRYICAKMNKVMTAVDLYSYNKPWGCCIMKILHTLACKLKIFWTPAHNVRSK